MATPINRWLISLAERVRRNEGFRFDESLRQPQIMRRGDSTWSNAGNN